MSDISREPDASPPRPPGANSRHWLVAAVIATAIALAIAFLSLTSLSRWPASQGAQTPAAPIDTASAITVAVARTPGGPGEWSNWARVIKYLSEEIERPITVRYLSKEDEAAEVIAAEDVDVAFVCANHYLNLREQGEVVGICTPVMGGSTTNHMWLVVRADDSAESFEDLAGSAVGASDKSSLGGYSYLSLLAQERGVEPLDYFSELRLGDAQEANMRDVLSGELRATVVNSAQVLSWDMSQFKIIEESPPIGCPPVVVDENMPDELREQITAAFLNMDVASVVADKTEIDGFRPLDEAEYAYSEQLRDACGHHTHQ